MKKKKNDIPIVLSNQELIPSVIGVINEKEKSNWVVVVLFVILIIFIICLPTITSYISGEKQISFTPNTNNPDKPNNPGPGVETTFYDFESGLEVPIEGLLIKNFNIFIFRGFYVSVLYLPHFQSSPSL